MAGAGYIVEKIPFVVRYRWRAGDGSVLLLLLLLLLLVHDFG